MPGWRKPERVGARQPEREALSPWAWRAKQRSRLEIITWSEDTVETRTGAPRDSWAREVALVTFPEFGCMAASEASGGLRRASGRRKWLRER